MLLLSKMVKTPQISHFTEFNNCDVEIEADLLGVVLGPYCNNFEAHTKHKLWSHCKANTCSTIDPHLQHSKFSKESCS